jgi:hypothetical protein
VFELPAVSVAAPPGMRTVMLVVLPAGMTSNAYSVCDTILKLVPLALTITTSSSKKPTTSLLNLTLTGIGLLLVGRASGVLSLSTTNGSESYTTTRLELPAYRDNMCVI